MSDEMERAQRSVERMFPEVARFLGQLRHELPLFGPTDLFDDEGVRPDVIVRVDYALSFRQLHAALVVAFTEIAEGRSPEDLSVVEVRTEVEGYLAAQGIVAVDNQMADAEHRDLTAEQQRIVQGLVEAIERAYPPRREPDRVQQPVYGDGTVTVETQDHGEIVIDEPAWCLGHDDEPIGYRADVTHRGPWEAAEFAGVEFLPAGISWAPFSELHPEPYPVADVWEFPPMEPDQLRQLAALVGSQAGRLYRLANHVDQIRRGMS